MITDATKKLREPVAYILLAFAGLVALASLIRLFVGSEFTSSAGVVQGTLTPPGLTALVLLAALAGSVALVTEFGGPTPNARTVTLAALAITGVNVLLGLITAFAGFGETGDAGLKIVGFIYAIGGLTLYGAVGLYLFKTFQALPAPVRVPKAGAHGQFAGQGQYGQYGGQYGQPGAQGQYGQGQYGQPEPGQGQYGQYGAGAAGGYVAGQAEGQWPQQEGWNQAEQQQAWPTEAEGATADSANAQAAEQPWPAAAHPAEQQTQQWPADAGQQWPAADAGQQWPQEQQQWPAQEYGQQAQPEWQPGQAQPGEQGWSQQGWQQGESWPAQETPPAGSAEAPAEAAADETRVDGAQPDKDSQDKKGQGEQQGWWSQPS